MLEAFSSHQSCLERSSSVGSGFEPRAICFFFICHFYCSHYPKTITVKSTIHSARGVRLLPVHPGLCALYQAQGWGHPSHARFLCLWLASWQNICGDQSRNQALWMCWLKLSGLNTVWKVSCLGVKVLKEAVGEEVPTPTIRIWGINKRVQMWPGQLGAER